MTVARAMRPHAARKPLGVTALAALGALLLLLTGCTGAAPTKAGDTHAERTSTTSTTVSPTPAAAATKQVPKGLVGKTMREAKAVLAKAGFDHVAIAGGHGVTDATKVTEVSHAGKRVAPDTKIVLTGKAVVSTRPTAVDEASGEHATAPHTERRHAPSYGAQCMPGDEQHYSVCAGHKRWVDGQVEYANCLHSGGHWDVASQSCVHGRHTSSAG